MAANKSASRRRAPPKSVPARTTPAQTMPMQISLARVMATECLPVRTAGRTELVARDNRGRVAGQCRGIGREVSQKRGDESASGPPQRQPDEKRRAILRKARGQHDDRDGADTVPIMRYQPLRSEAPRCGWQTIAAEVPAQYALSSSSQNAT